VLGDNDRQLQRNLRTEYETLAAELGIGQKTHFLGFRDDVRPYLADFDVLALPSRSPEPFGRVLIEAMALGVPPVIAAHGGAVEVVEHGRSGLAFDPRDIAGLADHIATLLRDKDLRMRLGVGAVRDVRARFDGRIVASRITRYLYEAARRAPSNGE
jgi:glycosyltransferase involved in cell wall biosynthesis